MKAVKFLNFLNFIHHKLSKNHKNIRNKIIKIIKINKNNLYDFGEGFFYQSIPPINLKGLRDTEKRVRKLNLNHYLENSTFLDIGTNIGSIPLSINCKFRYGIGIDHNEATIKVAQTIQDYLKIKNLKFIVDDFLTYKFNTSFDVILSLANHSTFDKGISDTRRYLDKIHTLLNKNGLLIIESHNILYEKSESYLNMINNLNDFYEIIKSGKYDFGNFYDKDRIFHILKKK